MLDYPENSRHILIKIAFDGDGCLLNLQMGDKDYVNIYRHYSNQYYKELIQAEKTNPNPSASETWSSKEAQLRAEAAYRASQQAMAELSGGLINHLILEFGLLNSDHFTKSFHFEFTSGSARQSLGIEHYNATQNQNGYFFSTLIMLKEKFEERLKELSITNATVTLDLSCYADELHDKPKGYSFSEAKAIEYMANAQSRSAHPDLEDDAIEELKVMMTLRHINGLPKTNESGLLFDTRYYVLIDDRTDIHVAIWNFLSVEAHQRCIQENVKVHLWHFEGLVAQLRSSICALEHTEGPGIKPEHLRFMNRLLGFFDYKAKTYIRKPELLSALITRGFPRKINPVLKVDFSPLEILGRPTSKAKIIQSANHLQIIITGIKNTPSFYGQFHQKNDAADEHSVWVQFKNLFSEVTRLLGHQKPLHEAIQMGNSQRVGRIMTKIINPYLTGNNKQILKDLIFFGIEPYIIIFELLELRQNATEQTKHVAKLCFAIHKIFPIYDSIVGSPDDWKVVYGSLSFKKRLKRHLNADDAVKFDKLFENPALTKTQAETTPLEAATATIPSSDELDLHSTTLQNITPPAATPFWAPLKSCITLEGTTSSEDTTLPDSTITAKTIASSEDTAHEQQVAGIRSLIG
ncbi:MAG: hypothetical protein JSS53_06590 [Proteobacteria bacterium]|nr:hypothetical protein [Pseudomonadota bacterium]